MRKHRVAALVLALFVCAGSAFAENAARGEYVEGEALVLLENAAAGAGRGSMAFESAVAASANSVASSVGALVARTYGALADEDGRFIVHLRAEGKSTAELLASLEKIPGVVGAAPNRLRRALKTPNDPRYGELWGMEKIGAPDAWETSTGSSEVFVAVIDTGIDYEHPDLADNMGRDKDGNVGWDFVGKHNRPMDTDGHGTHVAGSIGAAGNNGVGVTGVNWDVGLLALQVFGKDGKTADSVSIEAMNYVLAQKRRGLNIRVVNISIGDWEEPIKDQEKNPYGAAIKALSDAGVLVVIAAGNEYQDIDNPGGPGSDPDHPKTDYRKQLPYPACFRFANTITVAAIASDGTRSDFSNYSPDYVHLAAPGSAILSTLPGKKYASWNGTSMATPYVAGAAALLAAAYPDESAGQIKARLLKNVTKTSGLSEVVATGGYLNLKAAVAAKASAAAPESVRPSSRPVIAGDAPLPGESVPTNAVPFRVDVPLSATPERERGLLHAALKKDLALPEAISEELAALLDADDSGHVYLSAEAVARAKRLLPGPSIPENAPTAVLAVFSGAIGEDAAVSSAADVKTTAIAFFPIPDVFFGKSAASLRVVKVRRADSVEEFTQVFTFENLTDARFAVVEVEFLPDGKHLRRALGSAETIGPNCRIAVAIKDGGVGDVDGASDGDVVAALFAVGETSERSSSGCAGGAFHPAALVLLAPLALLMKKLGK